VAQTELANEFIRVARSGASLSNLGPVTSVICIQAVLSILAHSSRRNPGQDRVIGTLVGRRSDDGREIELRDAFPVPHNEGSEQVEVDMEYHKNMLLLHQRANPKDVLVGWYATDSSLNLFDALIQNFYSSPPDGTYPFPAVHLTVSSNSRSKFEYRAYISSPVGISSERLAGSCLFQAIPCDAAYSEAELAGLNSLLRAGADNSRRSEVNNDIVEFESTLKSLSSSISSVLRLLEDETAKGNPNFDTFGKELYSAISFNRTHNLENFEQLFNNHLQDVLLAVYLINTVRTQMTISAQLAM